MSREVYSEAEQSLKEGGRYMVSASIKTAKFTLKEFDKLCRFIARCISGKDKVIMGKQSLKDLISHGNKVVEIGADMPTPEEMLADGAAPDKYSWGKDMLKGFEKYADEYGINYSILQEKSLKGEKTFHVFFEGKDASIVGKCLQDYMKDQAKRKSRPSILQRMKSYQERISEQQTHSRQRVNGDKIKDKVPRHEER